MKNDKLKILFAPLLCGLSIFGYALWQKQPEQIPDSQIESTRAIMVNYTVSQNVWGKRRPNLCDIAAEIGLDEDARSATMDINGPTGGCASRNQRYSNGNVVKLVVWVPNDGKNRRSCRNSCAGAPAN